MKFENIKGLSPLFNLKSSVLAATIAIGMLRYAPVHAGEICSEQKTSSDLHSQNLRLADENFEKRFWTGVFGVVVLTGIGVPALAWLEDRKLPKDFRKPTI